MYLIDTNIFLEILLDQEKQEKCKKFLTKNADSLSISDFTLHSIGVILLRQNKSEIYLRFADDILPQVTILSLPKSNYRDIVSASKSLRLDFDDANQYLVAKANDLTIVTLDSDFKKVKETKVKFL